MAETQKPKMLQPAEIHTGMHIRVHQKIKDLTAKGEEKERIQIFEGLVINLRGAGISKTMTVRKISDGIGVERIYPIFSPVIDHLELVRQFKTRRKHLGFIRHSKKKLKEIRATV